MQALLSKRQIITGVLLVVLIMLGVASGIYVGVRLLGPFAPQNINRDNFRVGSHSVEVASVADLSLRPGDLFPLEQILLDGHDTTFDAVLADHRTIVILIALGCSHCEDLLDYWQTHLAGHVPDDIRLIIGVGREHGEISPGYAALFAGATVVRYDEQRFSQMRYVNMFPSLYCVDRDGFIVTIQAGFSENIPPAVLSFLTGQR